MKKLLPSLLLLFISATCYAQLTSGAQTLRLARATYEQGRLHEIPSILEGFLTKFTKQEKVEAYKLLTLSYIYLEEPEKADDAMLKLLQTDHYFEINLKDDPAEFIALYRTFRTKPIYRIGGKIGINSTKPNVVEAIEANSGTSKYSSKIGFQLHVASEIPLVNNLVLAPEIGIMQRNFSYSNEVTFADTTFTTLASEKQTWISLPVSLQYHFKKFKFNPYVGIGVEADYLLGSTLTASRTRQGYQFIEEKSFDLKAQREKFNISAIASIGAHFALGGGFVITEVRFAYGLTKVNSSGTAFAVDSNLPFAYGYADSVFKLNSISLTAGYIHNIFSPKKLSKRK